MTDLTESEYICIGTALHRLADVYAFPLMYSEVPLEIIKQIPNRLREIDSILGKLNLPSRELILTKRCE